MGCPTEVARQPRREDNNKARGKSAWAHGDCCVKDGHETSKWVRKADCKALAVKNRDACKPKGNQKCCFHTEGKKLTAVKITKDCETPTKPKCPKGDGRENPTSCESGCCVYDYETPKFGCVGKGQNGQCPPAKKHEQTCTAGRGKNKDEICQPDSDHKCCLSSNGKALLIRKKADPCPAKQPLRCKDQKAAKIAECDEKEVEEVKKEVQNRKRSQKGAAEADGSSLRPLTPATLLFLLLLLPH